jgi:hypothetical protein
MQAGTQSRSRRDIAEAVAWVRAGNLGPIRGVRGLCYKRRPSIGLTTGPQPVPPAVDYNLWLGPAPMAPLRRKELHYDWHWVWPTGNGDLGNQGVHQMDVARWFLGDPQIAPHTLTVGGRLGYKDDGQTPNTLVTVHDYREAPLIFEVRGLPARPGTEEMDRYPDARIGADIGVIVHCEGGIVVASNGSRFSKGAEQTGNDYGAVLAFDRQGRQVKSFDSSGILDAEKDHFSNFLETVRSRRTENLRASIECGYLSAGLCHTANISYRLGRALPPGEVRERVKDNAAVSEAYGRMLDHLALNHAEVERAGITLGMPVAFDSAAELFHGNEAASRLLTREYRHPFVVPKIA